MVMVKINTKYILGNSNSSELKEVKIRGVKNKSRR